MKFYSAFLFPVFVLTLASLASPLAIGGETSDRWIGFSGSSKGHDQLHHHLFYTRLKEGHSSPQEIAVFLRDRIFYFEFLENQVAQFIVDSDVPHEILYRSRAYRLEAQELNRSGVDIPQEPSTAAKEYVTFLSHQSQVTVLYHYLIHIAGEGFGAYLMADQISKLKGLEKLGQYIRNLGPNAARNNGNIPRDARTLVHDLANSFFPENGERTRSMTDLYVKKQADLIFEYSAEIFDAAVRTVASRANLSAEAPNSDDSDDSEDLGSLHIPGQSLFPWNWLRALWRE